MPNIGINCGEVYFVTPEALPYKNNALAPNAIMLRSEKANLKFLYYLFLSEEFQGYIKKYKTSSTMPILNKTNFEKLEIPLPPLDEQERIVRILDSLNELANGLSAGIPKEIELRQKQYEYWRDRLLEFPSKDSK